MSAFMVSNATISKVLDGIHLIQPWDCDPFNSRNDAATMNKLGRDLLEMNARAVTARYGDDEHMNPGDEPGADYKWPGMYHQTKPIEAYKAAQCLLYQCSEGTVDQEPLFKALMQYKSQVADEIVRKVDAYNATPWDFPENSYAPANAPIKMIVT